jgi:hypothetical protein
MLSGAEVLRYLKAVDFPADRDGLVQAAERAGAPHEVLRALRAMPPVDYHNTDEVVRSADTDPAAGQSPADLAARARDRRHQRVSRHLRGI